MKKIGFLIGHADYLPQARALAASIIEHTSLTREYQVFAMTPEHLALVIDIPGVMSRTFMLPEPYRSIPFVDKMLAAAAFEQQCGEGYIWLDIDSYFLRDIAFPAAGAAFVDPVDMKNIGDGYGGERSPIWRLLNAYFGLADDQPPVVTGVSGEKIYSYFNAGMVLVNEPQNLFATVALAIRDLLAQEAVQRGLAASRLQQIFFHQAVFSCALLKLYGGRIAALPRGINYPLHLHSANPKPLALDEISSFRYDNYFNLHCVPAEWRRVFSQDEKELRSHWYYPES